MNHPDKEVTIDIACSSFDTFSGRRIGSSLYDWTASYIYLQILQKNTVACSNATENNFGLVKEGILGNATTHSLCSIFSNQYFGKKTKSAAATNKRQIGDKTISARKVLVQRRHLPPITSYQKATVQQLIKQMYMYQQHRQVTFPTDEEQKQFLESLAPCSKAKPAVFSVLLE